ncbi:MAG: radical SAM family heme chaperone HemW [Thermodesulfobacteriota bacterium]
MNFHDFFPPPPAPLPLAILPGLYIHIPFCQSKCPYCDFYSITVSDLIPGYLAALEAEARLYRAQFPAFDTLYLGGGTPSWLSAVHLAELMQILRRHFAFAPESEITIEANPDDISPEKLTLWRDLGINRLSLGCQSFDEAELRFLGRRHTARQTEQALGVIRDAGFTNIGIDLMYGLPGQTTAAWIKTLEAALRFNPKHLSCYQLTLAPETPMGRRAAQGDLVPLDEEAQREFFLFTARYLTERGYLHYEVANFARAEGPQAGGLCYCCRHNRKYWTHVPYLGLGPGAHSFDGNRRWWNVLSVEQYCSSLNAGGSPVAGQETLTPEQINLETLYLGFRTREGVGLSAIREHPQGEAILSELVEAGLVRVDCDRVRPTPDGLVIADRLPLWFAD